MDLEFDLPKPLAFLLAQPWILHEGRIYQPGRIEGGEAENYIELNSKKFSLAEIETAKGLEDFYFLKNAQDIERCEQEYMQRAVNTEFRSTENINRELSRNKVLHLLVDKVLPVITRFNTDDQLTMLIEEEENGVAHNDNPNNDNFINAMAEAVSNQTQRDNRNRNTQDADGAMQRELQQQKRRLVSAINQEYAQYEHQPARQRRQRRETIDTTRNAQGAVLDQLAQAIESTYANVAPRNARQERQRAQPLRDNSILTSHLFPQRNIMAYANGVHDLVTAAEWISYFEEHIERGFYRQLQGMSPSRDPDEIYETIKNRKDQVEKRYLSRLILKLQTSRLKISGDFFFPIKIEEQSLDGIEQVYKKLMEKDIKLKAIDHHEFQTEQLAQIQSQREALSRIANLEKFDMEGAGYEKIGEEYFAYVTTPEYALKGIRVNGPDNYLPMAPAKVGVSVSYRNNQFVIGNPVIMNDYQHPFLFGMGRHSMRQICLGTYAYRNNPYRRDGTMRSAVPEKRILDLLSKATEILMMGYVTGRGEHIRVDKHNFSGWTTKQEIERRGLPCYNDFTPARRPTTRYGW